MIKSVDLTIIGAGMIGIAIAGICSGLEFRLVPTISWYALKTIYSDF